METLAREGIYDDNIVVLLVLGSSHPTTYSTKELSLKILAQLCPGRVIGSNDVCQILLSAALTNKISKVITACQPKNGLRAAHAVSGFPVASRVRIT